MKVSTLIAYLSQAPPDYDVCVVRGGAYNDAKVVEVNDELQTVFVSDDDDSDA